MASLEITLVLAEIHRDEDSTVRYLNEMTTTHLLTRTSENHLTNRTNFSQNENKHIEFCRILCVTIIMLRNLPNSGTYVWCDLSVLK